MSLSEKKYQLTAMLLGEHCIEDLLNKAEEVLGQPLIYVDLSYNVIGSPGAHTIPDSNWRQALKQGFGDIDFALKLTKKDTYKNQHPYLDHTLNPLSSLICNVFLNQSYFIGFVFIWGGPFSADCQNLLHLTAGVLSAYLSRDLTYQFAHGYENENVLYDLLSVGRCLPGTSGFDTHLHRSTLKNRPPYTVLILQADGLYPDDHLIQYSVKDTLYTLFPHLTTVYFNQYLVCLTDSLPDAELIKRQDALATLGQAHHFHIGISLCFDNLLDFYSHFLQAEAALAYHTDAYPVAYFKNYRYRHLIQLLHQHQHLDLREYICPALSILKEYDAENGTELFFTLKQFAENGFRAKETFSAMHIHRNTLNYRMERILALTGLNLEDPDTRFELLLSFNILKALKGQI